MKVLERMKAPEDKAKKQAKRIRGRAKDVADKGRDKAEDVSKYALTDEARKDLSDALDLIFNKVRESGTLSKLQDETHKQMSDAVEVARGKVKDNVPAAKSKISDAKDEVLSRLPGRKKKRSKVRTLIMIMVVGPAVISTLFALKKKMDSRRDDRDDYDAGGELRWGDTSNFNASTEDSTANAEVQKTAYEPSISNTPVSNGVSSSTMANGVSSSRSESDKGPTPDASSELANE